MSTGDNDSTSNKNESSMSMPMWLAVKSLQAKFPRVRNLSTDLLCQWLYPPTDESGDSLIQQDTRAKEEYDVSHLPGAILIEPGKSHINEILQTIDAQCSKQPCRAIVCYCSIGYRSSSLAQKLKSAMDSQEKGAVCNEIPVYNLEGSIFKWANESKPMINAHDKPTIYAHPYNVVYGKLLEHSLKRSSLDSLFESGEECNKS